MRRNTAAGLRVLACLLLAAASRAQNVTGTIVGTVRDPSKAVVVGAKVTVINEERNRRFTTQTDARGHFVAPQLFPGVYRVHFEAPGFQETFVREVRLTANRTIRVDTVLEPGTVAESVEVRASGSLIASENATLGTTIESPMIAGLPLNGRTLDRLIRISSGVTTDSASNPGVAGSSYWGGIQFNVDGASYQDAANGGGVNSFRNGLTTLPSVDAIKEFKIDSNNQKAEFEGSASVTVVTKAGTNDLHGSFFEFNRNRVFAAKNFAATALPKPGFNRNEFGAAMGGALRRDRSFYFANYEGLRERFTRTTRLSVPTESMRIGDFRGQALLWDPLAGGPFPQNRIPDARIDPRSRQLLAFLPLPNDLSGGDLANYTVNLPNTTNIDRFGLRLDHAVRDPDHLWFGLNFSRGSPYTVSQPYPPGYGSWSDAGYDTGNLSLTWSHSFSSRTLNEARYAGLFNGSTRAGMNTDFDPRSLFPSLYGPLPVGGLPYVTISGYTAIGDFGGSAQNKQFTQQFMDNFTVVRGRHTIKAGVDLGNYRISSPAATFGLGSGVALDAGLGRFNFPGRYTNIDPTKPALPVHSFADFLLGYALSTSRATPAPGNLWYSTRYSAFVQDDLQVSRKLTFNLGLRYMVQTAWQERDGAQANLDFATGRLLIPGNRLPPQAQPRLLNAYPIANGDAANLHSQKDNFAPRVGFAYRPFGNSSMVVRGGAGFYYVPLPLFLGFRQLGYSNPPFLLAETFDAQAGVNPSLTLADPFPARAASASNPSINAVETNLKNARSQQWNLTLERQAWRSLVLRASYVGSRNVHLPWSNRSINVPRQQDIGALQPRRPIQPWADIFLLATGGDSILHQLQLEAVRRLPHGFLFQAEYSWTRSIDDVPIVGGPQNPYDNRADRGNSDAIRRHIFSLAYTYALPFGPGRKWASGGRWSKALEGWQIAGITLVRTGPPFSVTFRPTQPGWLPGRARLLTDPKLPRGERGIDRWFDTTAFAVPAPFTYGNSGRNILFGPGDIVIDVSLLKDIRIGDRLTVQFRAESFNMPNHTNLGMPSADLSSPSTFGRIYSAGDPRQIQFGLKALF